MGRSMPVTPRVGMAAATIIIVAMVTSSPHCRPHCRLGRASITWTVIRRKKSRQYAAGVDEEKPMGVPLTSMVVWGHTHGDDNAQQGTEKQAAESDVGVGAFPGPGRGAFGDTGPQTGGDFFFSSRMPRLQSLGGLGTGIL